MKKICFITGTRAEYGLLKQLMYLVKRDNSLDFQLIVTGSHLSENHGNTAQEILNDGFTIDALIPILSEQDSDLEVARASGKCLTEIANTLEDLGPEVVVLLGDRYEIMSAAISAFLLHIPIAHIHGGEVTHGAMDDSIRHAITKISNYHFVANREFEHRVIQLGEASEFTFMVGGLGVDAISKITFDSKSSLEQKLGIRFREKIFLITFNPVTNNADSGIAQFMELVSALKEFEEVTVIFTYPNADSGNSFLRNIIESQVNEDNDWFAFESLGQQRYLSLAAISNAVIGNSSSGLLEYPSLGVPTVNIGERQNGRPCASSVISCSPTKAQILKSIQISLSDDFREQARSSINPYGDGGASQRIFEILKGLDPFSNRVKIFRDLHQ